MKRKQPTNSRWLAALAAAGALAYGGASFALYEDDELWGVDELGTDEYGYYDSDFEWGLDDEDEGAFNDWYGDADEDWSLYDDSDEEGWFDF